MFALVQGVIGRRPARAAVGKPLDHFECVATVTRVVLVVVGAEADDANSVAVPVPKALTVPVNSVRKWLRVQ